MTEKDIPITACGSCGGTVLGIVDDVRIELLSAALLLGGNVIEQTFRVVVCANCGETRFFVQPGRFHFLNAFQHQLVDVGPKTPYR